MTFLKQSYPEMGIEERQALARVRKAGVKSPSDEDILSWIRSLSSPQTVLNASLKGIREVAQCF